jgi:hypothetical protein
MISTHYPINNTRGAKKNIQGQKLKKSELINQLPIYGRAKKKFKGQKS